LDKFVIYLESNGISFNEINSDIVRDFLLTIGFLSKSTIAGIHLNLRNIFCTCFENGFIPEDLSYCCDKISVPKNRLIPSAYTAEEVERLLNAVDRGNANGKRDYCILLLAARLGIRVGDIRNLCFKNIDWVANKINFTQEKTQKYIELPMSEEIGWAIIEYLKNGRPKSNSEHIFVKHTPPFEDFGSHYSFDQLVGKYLNRANIKVPRNKKQGLHSLRHSLASTMLSEGIPLPVISETLGHKNTKNTKIYTKIDIKQLSICSLSAEFGDTE
jgi:site-specific recombinase XerD